MGNPGKVVYPKGYQEFESPPLRNSGRDAFSRLMTNGSAASMLRILSLSTGFEPCARITERAKPLGEREPLTLQLLPLLQKLLDGIFVV